MASLELPAGTYAIHALADLTTFGFEHIDCRVQAPGGSTGSYRVVVRPPDSSAQATASGVIETTGGRAEMACHRYTVPEQKLRLTDLSLMAVQADTHIVQ